MTTKPFVETSIARYLIARMQATHERRRIAVFSGPPGIGKTTAIDRWRKDKRGQVAVVKIGRQDAKESIVLQHALEAVRALSRSEFQYTPTALFELRRDVYGAICSLCDADPTAARRGEYDAAQFPLLTLVFDEAQNLSRQAIEALRYWNDLDRCYAPFPIGLIFIGNSEFSLDDSRPGGSVISAAVADRALYVRTFEYGEVEDGDLRKVIEAHGVTNSDAVHLLVRSLRAPRAVRSLRQLVDMLDDLKFAAGRRPVDEYVVREALALT